jgi:hypothetical protein
MKNKWLYFTSTKELVYIYGYYSHLSAQEFADMINKTIERIVYGTKCLNTDIRFYEITTSRRYLHMIAFIVKTDVIPDNVYKVTNPDWNAEKWLTD